MMKRIFRISIFIILILGIIHASGGLQSLLSPNTVRAFGELLVDFHVAPGTPIFNSTNMAPGDPPVSKPVDVTNSGALTRMIAVKGVRTGGVGVAPKLETILDLIIFDGAIPIYGSGSPTGPKTVANFFTDSSTDEGVLMGQISPGGTKNYILRVTFPSLAGNEFQNKSVIFDLTFGTVTANHIVINEVHPFPDSAHGIDGVRIPGNSKSTTGGQSDEWIELFNPTTTSVSLKNWSLVTSKGTQKINANKSIPSESFALVSKDASTWKYWSEPNKTLIVELGNWFPTGLSNSGDHVYLLNAVGTVVDRTSWGTDTTGFSPPALLVAPTSGKSLNRIVPGFDTDTVADWVSPSTPTPGL